jgi:predicted HD superfamily hydrolase involved in NAD metabolism
LKYDKFKTIIREKLDDYRYAHSLAVADEAARLAEKYGADKERAYLAGLLHDITKNINKEEHLKIFDSFAIILSDLEINAPKLWHAISGSVYVSEVLKIEDSELISAIRYHTTGKAAMSLFELVLFIADFTSHDRNYPDVEVMRELADKSLIEAAVYALSYTVNDLNKQGSAVHPDTLSALEYYKTLV